MVYSARLKARRSVRRHAKAKRSARRGARRAGRSGSGGGSRQTARITETIEIVDFNPNTSYANVFTLSQFARASSIAPFFRWYKATKVSWQYEPLYNTFQEGSGPSVSAPYFYSLMNRTQDNHITTLNDIQACGAKPVKLTKILTKTYRPNWCSPGLITYGQAPSGLAPPMATQYVVGLYNNGLKPEYGWLQSPNAVVTDGTGLQMTPIVASLQATPGGSAGGPKMSQNNANQVLYNGHDVFIDQQNAPAATVVCRLTCTVHWVFKDPNNATNLSNNSITVAGKYESPE